MECQSSSQGAAGEGEGPNRQKRMHSGSVPGSAAKKSKFPESEEPLEQGSFDPLASGTETGGESTGDALLRMALAAAFVAAAASVQLHAFGRREKQDPVAAEEMNGSKLAVEPSTAGPSDPSRVLATEAATGSWSWSAAGRDPVQGEGQMKRLTSKRKREYLQEKQEAMAAELVSGSNPAAELVGEAKSKALEMQQERQLVPSFDDPPTEPIPAARPSLHRTLPPPPSGMQTSGSIPVEMTEGQREQRWIVDPSAIRPGLLASERPLPPRYPLYPSTGPVEAIFQWKRDYKRISDEAAKDPLNNIPILTMSKDSDTTNSMISPKEKETIQIVANATVNVSSTADGERTLHYSGIIMGTFKANERATVLTCSRSVCDQNGKLSGRKVIIHLPDKTALEPKLLWFNHFYGVAILEVQAEVPLCGPIFASGPKSGEEAFILSRDENSLLRIRNGTVLWYDESYLDRNFYMYLSCNLAQSSTGGPVVNKDGQVTGMAFHLATKYPAVLPISIIVKCMEMCSKFSCVAIPWHGLRLRTVERLNMDCRDAAVSHHKINSGYLVDKVSSRSSAEEYGIRRGDVIAFFDGMNSHSLQQLEHHLLSLGSQFLEMKMKTGSSPWVSLELRVVDLLGRYGRTISLPVEFSCFPAGVDGALLGQDVGAAESEMTVQRQEADPWVAAQLERAVQFINLR